MNNNDNSALKNYSPPAATDLVSGDVAVRPLSMFDSYGRIGRLRYISWIVKVQLCMMLIILALAVIVIGIGSDGKAIASLASSSGVIGFLTGIIFSMKRLQDMNANKWFALCVFIPVANIILGLACLLLPGTKGENLYGPPEPPLTTLDKCMLWLIPLSFLLGILAAIIVPASQSY